MTLSRRLSLLASVGVLSACTQFVQIPVIEGQPTVSQPDVPLNSQTSVTGTASPTFSTLPAVPSPATAEASAQPVRSGVVTRTDKPVKKAPVVRAPAR